MAIEFISVFCMVRVVLVLQIILMPKPCHESWIVDAVHLISLLLALFICLPVIWCAVTLLSAHLLKLMFCSCIVIHASIHFDFLLLSETFETLGYEERLLCAMIALKYMFILQR